MLLLVITSILFVKKTYRSLLNPIIIFAVLWFSITTLSSLRLFQLFEIDSQTQQIISLGSLFFVISGIIAIWFRDKFYFKFSTDAVFEKNFEINYKLFFLLGSICFVYFVPDFITSVITLVQGGNLNMVRQVAQGMADSSGLKNFIGTFIVIPSATVLEILGVLDFWNNKKGRKLFYLSLAIIIIRVFGDAGRTPLFNVVIYLLLTIVANKFSRRTEKKNKKNTAKILKYGLLGSITLFISTLSRTTTTVYRKICIKWFCIFKWNFLLSVLYTKKYI